MGSYVGLIWATPAPKLAQTVATAPPQFDGHCSSLHAARCFFSLSPTRRLIKDG